MHPRTFVATLLLMAGFVAAPATAQETAQAEAPAEQAQNPGATMASTRDEAVQGQTYLKGAFTDWTLRCVRIEQVEDPCELHQPLRDAGGAPTAEFNIFPVPNGPAVAGSTIITPLETLLTKNLKMSIDGGEAKIYPFAFCNRIGCVAQVGFTQAEIDAMKRGSSAEIVIYPAAAPDSAVSLKLSLSGFTAGMETLSTLPQPDQ